ncbi:MAG: hypothetical protein RJB66_644 [Pseudomonadota bacterium]|jgi:hypothetical protein
MIFPVGMQPRPSVVGMKVLALSPDLITRLDEGVAFFLLVNFGLQILICFTVKTPVFFIVNK